MEIALKRYESGESVEEVLPPLVSKEEPSLEDKEEEKEEKETKARKVRMGVLTPPKVSFHTQSPYLEFILCL